MLPPIEKVKGIHPGVILEREIRKQGLKKGRLAIEIHEFPQVLTDITKKRRGINPVLSLKLGNVLGCDPSYFQVLQACYEVQRELNRQETDRKSAPDLTKLRSILFWDCDIAGIDWQNNREAVIKRVLERGNTEEQKEIMRFYQHRK